MHKEYRSCSVFQFQQLRTTARKSDKLLSDPKNKSYHSIRAFKTNNRRELFSLKQTTLYVHKKKHINQLRSGDKYETMQKARDTNTRQLQAEALAGAEDDDPLLFCSVPLASSPSPNPLLCTCCSSTLFPILLRRLAFHSHPPFAPSSSRRKLLVTAASKVNPEIARSMQARTRRSG